MITRGAFSNAQLTWRRAAAGDLVARMLGKAQLAQHSRKLRVLAMDKVQFRGCAINSQIINLPASVTFGSAAIKNCNSDYNYLKNLYFVFSTTWSSSAVDNRCQEDLKIELFQGCNDVEP